MAEAVRLNEATARVTESKKKWNLFRRSYFVAELSSRLALLLSLLLVYLFLPIFERKTIGSDWGHHAYPFAKEERFSEGFTVLIIAVTWIGIVISGVVLLKCRGRWTTHMIIEEMVLLLNGLLLSALAALFFTEMTKRMYGRLRPDFLSRCYGLDDIKQIMQLNHWDSYDEIPQIINKADCVDQKLVDDGRKSFPSGHSSLCFSVLVFCSSWIYGKLNDFRYFGAWRLVLPIAPIATALAVALSRTSDYRHHSSDVVAGSLLGTVSAVLSFCFYFPLTMQPLARGLYDTWRETKPNIRIPSSVLLTAPRQTKDPNPINPDSINV